MDHTRVILLGLMVGSLARAQTPQAVVGPVGIAVDPINGSVYWADEGTDRIQKSALDGSGIEDVVTVGLDDPRGLAVDLAAGKIYWGDSQTRKIQRANLDGSGIEDLITTGIVNPLDLVLDPAAGKMYWLDAATKQIQRANLDGSQVEELLNSTVLLTPKGVTLDTAAGKLYWSDQGSSTVLPAIQRANLDGTGVEVISRRILDEPKGMALDLTASKMYIADYRLRRIKRANLDGTGLEELVVLPAGQFPMLIALDLAAAKMYWASWLSTPGPPNMPAIQRANLDGSQVEDLVSGHLYPTGFTLDPVGGHMYVFAFGEVLQRRDLDGTNTVTLATGTGFGRGLALDLSAGKLYWADGSPSNIYRANLNGSSVETVLTDLDSVREIALDTASAKMYWTDDSDDVLQRANFDGSNMETIVTLGPGNFAPWGLALDSSAGLLYWSDSSSEKIHRTNFDGSNNETLLVTMVTPEGIAVSSDDGKLYWADSGNDRMLRMDLDGEHAEDLVASGLKDPHYLALDEAADKMYWTEGLSYSAKVRRADLSGANIETLIPGMANMIEITCVPLGGTTVRPGTIVEVECFVWTDFDQTFVGGQLDLPCSLPGVGGASGTITLQSSTADPDGDGIRTSSNGIPFLFGITGLFAYAFATCVTATTSCLSCLPLNLPGGSTRYLGTFLLQVSDCAAGDFKFRFENISQPPLPTDTTRYRDGDNFPAQGNLIPILHLPVTLTVAPFPYGDVNQSGVVDVDDIVCVLDGFRGVINCAGGDLAPCGGNGLLDVDDIISVLDAFRGFPACPPPDPCPSYP